VLLLLFVLAVCVVIAWMYLLVFIDTCMPCCSLEKSMQDCRRKLWLHQRGTTALVAIGAAANLVSGTGVCGAGGGARSSDQLA
jgi:hypothetical protein